MKEIKSGPLCLDGAAGVWIDMDQYNEILGRLLMHREARPILDKLNEIAMPVGDFDLMEREGVIA